MQRPRPPPAKGWQRKVSSNCVLTTFRRDESLPWLRLQESVFAISVRSRNFVTSADQIGMAPADQEMPRVTERRQQAVFDLAACGGKCLVHAFRQGGAILLTHVMPPSILRPGQSSAYKGAGNND